jgi:hypothetical protein
MVEKVFLEWQDVTDSWDTLNQTWDDVSILLQVQEVIRNRGGAQAYVEGNPWDITKNKIGVEKTKRFVELVCRVNDLDFKKVYETKEINVSVNHIQKTFVERLKIEIQI